MKTSVTLINRRYRGRTPTHPYPGVNPYPHVNNRTICTFVAAANESMSASDKESDDEGMSASDKESNDDRMSARGDRCLSSSVNDTSEGDS